MATTHLFTDVPEPRTGIYLDIHRYVTFEEVARALAIMTPAERAEVMRIKREHQAAMGAPED